MPHRKSDGYTLIELMIVVVIVGVLAAIAIPGYTSYLYRSRAAEAPTFLSEIRQRQETYRAEFGYFADCRTKFAPRAQGAADEEPFNWAGPSAVVDDCWVNLGAAPDNLVRFSYTFEGGNSTNPGPLGDTANAAAANDFYFVSQAWGDLNGDGTPFFFEGYSDTARLYASPTTGGRGWD